MKKFTYETYELLSTQNPEQFEQDFGEFIDMENPADLKYQVDFDEQYGIAAKSEDADVFAAWLPDGQYIFSDTSVAEVKEHIKTNYPNLFYSFKRKSPDLSRGNRESGDSNLL